MKLSAENLTCHRGGQLIFEGIGFALTEGMMMALTGPNGAGKSTLLRVIAGLIPPSAGTVRLDDGTATEAPYVTRMHYLGHLDAQKNALTVRENLSFWIRFLSGAENPSQTLEVLGEVGLGHLANLPARVLSAGQKRRLAVARLLAIKRPVWLLDEPTAALDAASERTFGGWLTSHLKEGGLVVAATHANLPRKPHAMLRLGDAT